MDLAEMEKALEGIRIGLKKDGADLVVNSINNDCIELSLIVQPGACLECIVSSDILLAKVRLVLSKIVQIVPRIMLHDPRNSQK